MRLKKGGSSRGAHTPGPLGFPSARLRKHGFRLRPTCCCTPPAQDTTSCTRSCFPSRHSSTSGLRCTTPRLRHGQPRLLEFAVVNPSDRGPRGVRSLAKRNALRARNRTSRTDEAAPDRLDAPLAQRPTLVCWPGPGASRGRRRDRHWASRGRSSSRARPAASGVPSAPGWREPGARSSSRPATRPGFRSLGEELTNAGPGACSWIAVDMASDGSVEAFARELEARGVAQPSSLAPPAAQDFCGFPGTAARAEVNHSTPWGISDLVHLSPACRCG